MSVIPALERWRKEDKAFRASLGYSGEFKVSLGSMKFSLRQQQIWSDTKFCWKYRIFRSFQPQKLSEIKIPSDHNDQEVINLDLLLVGIWIGVKYLDSNFAIFVKIADVHSLFLVFWLVRIYHADCILVSSHMYLVIFSRIRSLDSVKFCSAGVMNLWGLWVSSSEFTRCLESCNCGLKSVFSS